MLRYIKNLVTANNLGLENPQVVRFKDIQEIRLTEDRTGLILPAKTYRGYIRDTETYEYVEDDIVLGKEVTFPSSEREEEVDIEYYITEQPTLQQGIFTSDVSTYNNQLVLMGIYQEYSPDTMKSPSISICTAYGTDYNSGYIRTGKFGGNSTVSAENQRASVIGFEMRINPYRQISVGDTVYLNAMNVKLLNYYGNKVASTSLVVRLRNSDGSIAEEYTPATRRTYSGYDYYTDFNKNAIVLGEGQYITYRIDFTKGTFFPSAGLENASCRVCLYNSSSYLYTKSINQCKIGLYYRNYDDQFIEYRIQSIGEDEVGIGYLKGGLDNKWEWYKETLDTE